MSDLGIGSHTLPKDPNELKCLNFASTWMSCQSPWGMLTSYYRTGSAAADCNVEWTNLTTCISAKLKGYEVATKMLAEVNDEREAKREIITPIWEMRDVNDPPELFKPGNKNE